MRGDSQWVIAIGNLLMLVAKRYCAAGYYFGYAIFSEFEKSGKRFCCEFWKGFYVSPQKLRVILSF
jgi:hypothetical protein